MANNLLKQKQCYFCANSIKEIDYKDAKNLQRFLSSYAKILPRKKTGTCAKHQRKLARAVKRARHMALIPYTTR
ncbi:MAG: 30S ribosomal protein S18 [Candidatus Kerfeldbacteria bacterium CG08_land_8_20_14_0_20_40_16]|uniref:Small ribosomal subunit protein bS18 n=1 Tax=Candidatus Kerfeldbacteria bacterium CG08_land_8_20_14_0_20_40_16 TaxID=2014244 RepID=A0A2H0YXS2_9BACT|nr:MAG: 30S ribosomal protein S18 [Candidatus Kerfeldbacteria bacterium CG08_land_8_20_14_0_20_40_16]